MAVVVYTDATKKTIATEEYIATALANGASICIYSGYGDNKKEYVYWDRRRYQTIEDMIKSNWYNAIEIAMAIICDCLHDGFLERSRWTSDYEKEWSLYGCYNHFSDLYWRNGISDHDKEWQRFVLDHAIESDFNHLDKWIKEAEGSKRYYNNDIDQFYNFKFDHEMALIKRAASMIKKMIAKRKYNNSFDIVRYRIMNS